MIHKGHRILTLILICILLINFISEPKVEAAGIALGGLFGLELGEAILAFTLLLAAIGVTVETASDAEQLFYEYMAHTGNNPIRLPDVPPPEPPSGGSWKDIIKKVIVGGTAGLLAYGTFIDDIKDWFQSLGATEGENQYIVGETNIYFWEGNSIKILIDNTSTTRSIYTQYNNQAPKYVALGSDIVFSNVYITNIRPGTNAKLLGDIYWKYQNVGNENILNNSWIGAELTPNRTAGVPLPNNPIETYNYNLKPNSYVLTNTPPTSIPQPSLDVVPSIQPVTKPDGTQALVYPGTMDDLVDDLLNNTTWEDIVDASQSTSTTSYTLTETQSGVEIDFGTTIETPFPTPDTEPIEDTSEYQGKSIGLMQSIINWIKLLNDTITRGVLIILNLPKILVKLFTLPGGYFTNKNNIIRTAFSKKFNVDPWIAIVDSFKGIGGTPIPDLYLRGSKILDASYVNNQAPTVKNWTRGGFWILIALYNMNNVVKLIRGIDVINTGKEKPEENHNSSITRR